MFTNSRAGTPRRSVAPRSRTTTPNRFGHESTPARSSRALTGSPPASDGTVTRGKQHQPADSATASHAHQGNTLVVDEQHKVSTAFQLPAEVQELVNRSGLTYGDMLSLSLDFSAGVALLTTPSFVYTWTIANKASAAYHHYNICRFAVPPSNVSTDDLSIAVYAPLPLSCLVHYGSTAREPGLLVSSVDGHLRFWDSLSIARTGVERFASATLPGLEKGDIVRHVLAVSPGSFILSTSSAKLFKLTMTTAGGRTSLHVLPINRSRGMFSRLGSTLLGLGGSLPLSSNLGYIALCSSPTELPDGSKLLWAVRNRAVETWSLHPTDAGGEVMLDEWEGIDLTIKHQLLDQGDGLRGILPQTLDLQILDAAHQPGGDSLVFLLSHAAPAGSARSRAFALAVISFATNPPMLEHLSKFNYTADPDPRPLATPKLILSPRATFVVFADVAIMKNTNMEEVVALKPAAKARFLGWAVDQEENLVLPTAMHGVLKAQVLDAAPAQGLSRQQARTAKLTSQLERAVMFANRQDNPLSFELSLTEQGDLAQAAEQVSAGIVTSTSKYLSHTLDLRTDLAERSHALQSLAVLLNELNLVDKLPELTRQRLAWDAECMAASAALWHLYNAGEIDRSAHSLVNKAIELYLSEHGEDATDDMVRAFFRHRVGYIGHLLEVVDRALKTALNGLSMSSTRLSAASRAPLLLEANRIWLAVFSAAEKQRRDGNVLYRLSALDGPIKEPWTSRQALLDALQFLYDGTEQTLLWRSRELGLASTEDHSSWNTDELNNVSTDAQAELKSSLAEEAEYLLAMHEERIAYLKRNNATAHEVAAFEERYNSLRPKIINALVTVGRANPAFALAEQHRDFRTLMALCQEPSIGSSAKTHHYIQKFGSSTAFALYDLFVERNEFQALLHQDERYADLLLRYFGKSGHGRLSWLHDVVLGRYGHAASTLYVESQKTQSLQEQKTMLSIGKLADLAQVSVIEGLQTGLSRWNEKLDVVEMHRVILEAFRQNFSQADKLATPHRQAKIIMSQYGSQLETKPSFQSFFESCLLEVLEGSSLNTEDLVDMYTLQSQTTDPFRPDHLEAAESDPQLKASLYHWNFPPTLQLLLMSRDLPTGRSNAALAGLWRRVYLRDDWRFISQSASYTDDQLADIVRSTALYQTMLSVQSRGLPTSVILSPADARLSPGEKELRARFPDASQQDLEGLLTDYETETSELDTFIDSCLLQDFYSEAQRLLTQEAGQA